MNSQIIIIIGYYYIIVVQPSKLTKEKIIVDILQIKMSSNKKKFFHVDLRVCVCTSFVFLFHNHQKKKKTHAHEQPIQRVYFSPFLVLLL